MTAIGYVRVSSDKQADHGVSLEAQQEKVRAMAVVRGAELIDVIVDAGESAKSLDRPGMERVLAMVKAGSIDMVILDVGSLRKFDVYEEIEKLIPYAFSWLIKENVWYGEKPVPVDLHKVKAIIDRHGYRGYLPILTLGDGDPRQKVMKLANAMRRVFSV